MSRLFARLAPLLFAAALPAGPAAAQEAPRPTGEPVPAGVAAHRDLAYAADGHERQKLDLYLPEGRPANAAALPVVVWIHGGAFRAGSKDACPPLRAGYVARGYAVASVGYRLTPTAPFPAQIEDCRAAVRWLRAHADEYGLDAARIGVWGGSAGGHLAALLGTAAEETAWDAGENRDRSARVRAVCDYCGSTDLAAFMATPGYEAQGLTPDSPLYLLLDGPVAERAALARRASPITHVSADDPPFLILHGTDDAVVPPNQSERLDAALLAVGAKSTLLRLPDTGHAGGGGFDRPETHAAVAAFFDRHLKPAPAPAGESRAVEPPRQVR